MVTLGVKVWNIIFFVWGEKFGGPSSVHNCNRFTTLCGLKTKHWFCSQISSWARLRGVSLLTEAGRRLGVESFAHRVATNTGNHVGLQQGPAAEHLQFHVVASFQRSVSLEVEKEQSRSHIITYTQLQSHTASSVAHFTHKVPLTSKWRENRLYPLMEEWQRYGNIAGEQVISLGPFSERVLLSRCMDG